jgi:hypothetical protein
VTNRRRHVFAGASLTSDSDELREVARILAAAVLRLRARHALPEQAGGEEKNLPESSRNVLEVPNEMPLSGHSG